MIRKSTTTAFLLLALYQVWLNWVRPVGGQAVTYSLGGVVMAQKYLHSSHDYPVVLLGSSLTVKLERYMRRPDIHCLALIGKGPLDGIELMEHAGAHPKIVMLEINHLGRNPDRQFLDGLFKPELFWLHHTFTATTYAYQPENLLVTWLHTKISGRPQTYEDGQEEARPLPPNFPEPPEPPSERKSEDLANDMYGHLLNSPIIHQRLQKLGCQVVPFEVPEHTDVVNSSQAAQLRAAVEKEFGCPVLVDLKHHYVTSDGQHLENEYASAFAYFLLQQLDKIKAQRGLTSQPK